MPTKKFLFSVLALTASTWGYAQDLVKQVPEQAQLVAVINNQAIVKHSSFEKLNEVLAKLGAFEAINAKNNGTAANMLDLDLSYDRNAYIYKTDTDSSYYIGALIPLKAGHQIGKNVFSDFTPVATANGYQQISMPDGKTQIAWNDHSLFVLTGDYKSYYFQADSVAARYGIEMPITAAAEAWDATDSWADDVAVDSVVADAWEDYDLDVVPDTVIANDMSIPPPPVIIDTYADTVVADSATILTLPPTVADSDDDAYDYDDYDYDNYSDDAYQTEMSLNAKNDSIRRAAFTNWLAADFATYLQPQQTAFDKRILQYDKQNTLVHTWIKDMDDLYRSALPYDLFSMSFGFDMRQLDYGYQDAIIDLTVDKNVLKAKGSIGLDKDVQQLFAKMYKGKINRKFAKYIPENHLGYLSLKVNTEAYLNSLPVLMDRWYAPLVHQYSDLISIAGTAMEIALDEKALSKVMRGDHVVFINDLKKVKSEYIDYEYDEDYNYKQVTKTKEEEIPSFLWMFTSEDQRIFKKLLAFAEKENVVSQSEGIYRIAEKKSSMPFFVLFKDDMAFVGNDQEQLQQINNNSFKSSKDISVKKQIFANTMTATVHTDKIPEVINKLGVPIVGNWHKTVNDLSEYGDISIKSNGLKKNRIDAEFSVALPQKENNALQYILQMVLDNMNAAR